MAELFWTQLGVVREGRKGLGVRWTVSYDEVPPPMQTDVNYVEHGGRVKVSG